MINSKYYLGLFLALLLGAGIFVAQPFSASAKPAERCVIPGGPGCGPTPTNPNVAEPFTKNILCVAIDSPYAARISLIGKKKNGIASVTKIRYRTAPTFSLGRRNKIAIRSFRDRTPLLVKRNLKPTSGYLGFRVRPRLALPERTRINLKFTFNLRGGADISCQQQFSL
jgi:hypothetical protein